jgi:hypothetical protein
MRQKRPNRRHTTNLVKLIREERIRQGDLQQQFYEQLLLESDETERSNQRALRNDGEAR